MGEIKGYISQVIGPVVDIHFDYGTEETVTLPRVIRNAHHHADRRPSQRTFNECHRRPYRWHGPAY